MRTYTRSGKWLLHGVEDDHDNNGMERSQRRKKMVGRSFLGKTEQLPTSITTTFSPLPSTHTESRPRLRHRHRHRHRILPAHETT